MTAINPRHVTPRDIARILFRHWRKIALLSCGIVGVTLLMIALYPRSYASESKLLIRIGRESVALDPTATTGETITLQKTQEDEVNSALNILSSRKVFEDVIDRVGVERILRDRPPRRPEQVNASESTDVGTWIGKTLTSLRLSDPGTEIDQAVRRLESQSRVWAPKQSMVINIRYAAASPELAHDVVAAMTDVFLEEHSRLSQTEGSFQFFSEQAEKLHKDLKAAKPNCAIERMHTN